MKKYAILAAMALTGAGTAVAATAIPTPGSGANLVCTGTTAGKADVAGGPGQPYTAANSFIKTGFSVSCSTNSYVTFSNVSGTLFTVGSASGKGNQSFKGSSNGGAVTVHLKCSADPCVQADATTANTAASSM
jgi:hypothetical protein